jgi:hypothetical protein
VHLAFSAESGYYDAIISLTLAFLLPAFAERPLELLLKVEHCEVVRF